MLTINPHSIILRANNLHKINVLNSCFAAAWDFQALTPLVMWFLHFSCNGSLKADKERWKFKKKWKFKSHLWCDLSTSLTSLFWNGSSHGVRMSLGRKVLLIIVLVLILLSSNDYDFRPRDAPASFHQALLFFVRSQQVSFFLSKWEISSIH